MYEYLKRVANLINFTPMEVIDPMDQLRIIYAFMECSEKVGPIYEKYQSKKKTYFIKNSKED